MDAQTAERLIALWKSGRDKYRSFFTVLNEVRREIGDKELANWCFHELHIGMSVINHVIGVFNKSEAAAVKTELAEANRIEKERLKQQREKERQNHELKIMAQKSRDWTKINAARVIVRPLLEQRKPVKSKDLAKAYRKKHGGTMSHYIFEIA